MVTEQPDTTPEINGIVILAKLGVERCRTYYFASQTAFLGRFYIARQAWNGIQYTPLSNTSKLPGMLLQEIAESARKQLKLK
jgi:hypothetical protein